MLLLLLLLVVVAITITGSNEAPVEDVVDEAPSIEVLLASADALEKYRLPVLARLRDVQWAGLDPAQMALAYVNSRPFVTCTVIGATTMAMAM